MPVAARMSSLLLFAVLVAAGCAGPPGSAGGAAPTGARGSAQQAGPLVWYERTGGIAGFTDRLVVQMDGSYTITSSHGPDATGTLPAAEMAGLRGVLDGADFGSVPAGTPRPYPDAYQHHIRYAGHEVSVGDGAVPAGLAPVIDALAAIMHQHAGG